MAGDVLENVLNHAKAEQSKGDKEAPNPLANLIPIKSSSMEPIDKMIFPSGLLAAIGGVANMQLPSVVVNIFNTFPSSFLAGIISMPVVGQKHIFRMVGINEAPLFSGANNLSEGLGPVSSGIDTSYPTSPAFPSRGAMAEIESY